MKGYFRAKEKVCYMLVDTTKKNKIEKRGTGESE
jgi:hypothetical protein